MPFHLKHRQSMGIAKFCMQSASPELHRSTYHVGPKSRFTARENRKKERDHRKASKTGKNDLTVMCSHLRKMAKRIFRWSFRSFALIISTPRPSTPPRPIIINWPNTRFESRTFINQFFLPSGGIVYAICPWEHLFTLLFSCLPPGWTIQHKSKHRGNHFTE